MKVVVWGPTAVATGSLRWHWQFPDFVFFSRFRLPCGVPVMLCKALAWAKPESLLLFRLSKTRMRRAGRAGRAWHISARHKVASYSTAVATRAAVFHKPLPVPVPVAGAGALRGSMLAHTFLGLNAASSSRGPQACSLYCPHPRKPELACAWLV